MKFYKVVFGPRYGQWFVTPVSAGEEGVCLPIALAEAEVLNAFKV